MLIFTDIYFTSELLSAESFSSLLAFPVKWEEKKIPHYPHNDVKMALSSAVPNKFSRLWKKIV